MRILMRVLAVLVIVTALSPAQDPASRPAEVYTSIPLSDVESVEGSWPDAAARRGWSGGRFWTEVMTAGAEGFVTSPGNERSMRSRLLVLRSPAVADVLARLTVSHDDWSVDATRVTVRIRKEQLGNSTRADFLAEARKRFQALVSARVPGAAWFRHRVAECDAELPHEEPATRRNRAADIEEVGGGPEEEAADTFDFFSAGRAVSENLRLNRNLVPIEGGEPTISIDSIQGVTTKAFDWKAAAAKLSPAKDPLASKIPEDQHAAFFPNLGALVAVLDAIDAHAPLLWASEDRSEDTGARAFYESQLGVSAKELAAAEIARTIGSVAVTGSDPYFRTGTDIAILLECSKPEELKAYLQDQISIASLKRLAKVPFFSGEIGGKAYTACKTGDRVVSSYLAAFDDVVILSNSLNQLKRIIFPLRSVSPPLAESPEYTFFRDRYARGTAGETGFLVLTDATIRRWCSPCWRIADARRTRAAAQIADLTASHAEAIVLGRQPTVVGTPGLDFVGLGSEGIYSVTWGSLRFLKPIVEIPIDKVTQAEARAYERFRETYQRRWVNYFDPIAVRLELSATRTAIDATVMPLVEGTEYRSLIELTHGARFGSAACDPHATAAAQLVVALDVAGAEMERWRRGLQRLNPDLETVGLAWLKGGVSISLDQDSVLDELKDDLERRNENVLPRLPLLLTAEINDPVALAVFLTGLRASIDDTSLGTLRWTRGRHRDVETMTVGGLSGFGAREAPINIRYAIVGGLLLVSLREDVLQHAIDRALDRREGKPAAGPAWMGESVALRVDKSIVKIAAGWDAQRREFEEPARAWSAIPILNEWRRLFPDLDPVAVHEKLFHVRLLDPAGGRYVVDREKDLIFSETYGHPTETRPVPRIPRFFEGFKEARGGLTFENDGVRGRVVIEREGK